MKKRIGSGKELRDWQRVQAAHLLARAGYGGTPTQIDKLYALGPRKAVDWLLRDSDTSKVSTPAWLRGEESAAKAFFRNSLTKEERREKMQEFRMQQREHALELQGLWLERMVKSQHPLEEKMTFFWHDHFPTSFEKVKRAAFLYQQNMLLRREALGNFKRLTLSILQDPAMLLYLDASNSKKYNPNENLARELLELFTLGEGHYHEADIKGAARALTGIRLDRLTGRVWRDDLGWDERNKTVLGQSGPFGARELVDVIFSQKRCATFLAGKLVAFFLSENAPEGLVTDVADSLRSNAYELKPALRTLFLSPTFYASEYRHDRIKSPVELLVQMLRELELETPPHRVSFHMLKEMGQVPFLPPNVAGWSWGRPWINTTTLLTRYNVAGLITGGGDATDMARKLRRISRHLPEPDYQTLLPDDLRHKPHTLIPALLQRFFPTMEPNPEFTQTFLDYALTKAPTPIDNTNLARLIHLMMSTPQYQLH